MKDFIRLWLAYLNMNFKMWKEYRLDFVIGISTMVLAISGSVLYSWVIFQNVVSLNGWTFGQILFLQGILAFVNGVWGTFFSGLSSWRVDDEVRRGTFDQILIKPVGTMRFLVISGIDKDDFGRLITASIMLVMGSQLSGIVWSIQNIIMFLVTIASGVIIMFSLMTFFAALSFWTTRTHSLSSVIWHLMIFVRYPLTIYNPIIVFFITFIVPLGFVNFYPAEMFLGKGLYLQTAYLAPVMAVLFLVLSYLFFKFSLKHYASTGT